jgi:integrase
MPKKRLTEEGVAKLKPPPPGKQVDYFDAGMPGLVLRVNYGGAKIWRALYYVKRLNKDGKRVTAPTTHKLGRYPHLTVKTAREAARIFLRDPPKALAAADNGSFREVAENFIKRHVEANQLRTQAEIERCIAKYILPRWEHRPFREIKRGDVAALLDATEDAHGTRQADVVLAIISKLTNWYAARNDDYISPVVRGMHRTNGAERKRKRTLDDAEIRALWSIEGQFADFAKVLLLTAQRKDKIATMKWDDLSGDTWTIATSPREKGNPGVLRLPPMVMEIIERQPRRAENPYVFAGRGDSPLNGSGWHKRQLDAKLPAPMPPWVLHDLRRSARSLLSRAGVRPDLAERVLGHVIAGVEGIYDRHDYTDEKADALRRLAAQVERIIDPLADTVVRFPERAG